MATPTEGEELSAARARPSPATGRALARTAPPHVGRYRFRPTDSLLATKMRPSHARSSCPSTATSLRCPKWWTPPPLRPPRGIAAVDDSPPASKVRAQFALARRSCSGGHQCDAKLAFTAEGTFGVAPTLYPPPYFAPLRASNTAHSCPWINKPTLSSTVF